MTGDPPDGSGNDGSADADPAAANSGADDPGADDSATTNSGDPNDGSDDSSDGGDADFPDQNDAELQTLIALSDTEQPVDPPDRQAPFVARHAGISADMPHNFDPVSNEIAGLLAGAAGKIEGAVTQQVQALSAAAQQVAATLTAAFDALPGTALSALAPCPALHWIEIVLVDQDDNPVPNEAYRIIGPDGAEHTGTLDENGFARVDGLPAGTCQVGFPDIEDAAWQPQGGA